MGIRYLAGWSAVARALASRDLVNLVGGLQQAIRQYRLASFPYYRDYWRGQTDALLTALGAS